MPDDTVFVLFEARSGKQAQSIFTLNNLTTLLRAAITGIGEFTNGQLPSPQRFRAMSYG
jgi:hypothetical protein